MQQTHYRHIDELRTLLNPLQQAKFAQWVESNPAVMQMLGAL